MWRLNLVALACLVPGAALAQAAPPQTPPPDGLHATPSLYWQEGDHRVDLGFATRLRTESWDTVEPGNHWYTATRSRLHLQYSWRNEILAVGEFQDVQIHGMDSDGFGALSTYRNANGGESQTSSDAMRTLYFEIRPTPKSFIRAGRQDVKFDSQEIQYTEPNWRYLRTMRLGERLVGTVDWSHLGRAYDGMSGGVDVSGVELFGFGARPTRGVYEAEGGYRPLHDIFIGGATATLERGTLFANDELGLFGLYYLDTRPVSRGGLPDEVNVTTLGGQWLGVHPCGPGNFDVLLWGAYQTGRYNDLDQSAGAGIVELGYQLPNVFAKPWLRLGLNVASGDKDPGDGNHGTFFNMLPSNHPYYGFADQLAFQNLWDSFVQLRLAPHPMLALNLFVHQFRLLQEDDSRYSGTGAYDDTAFGFVASSSNGHRNVGTEYDLVATLTPHKAVTLEAGIEFLDGGAVFRSNAQPNTTLGYVSLELRY